MEMVAELPAEDESAFEAGTVVDDSGTFCAGIRETAIYTLCDPRTGEVRYVGKTTDPATRLYQHLNDQRYDAYKNRWVRRQVADGYPPVMRVLEWVDKDEWAETEKVWIRQLRAMGCRLTNSTDGGESGWSPVAREAAVKAIKAKPRTAEHSAKLSAALKGRTFSTGSQIGNAVLTEELVTELRIFIRGGGSGSAWAQERGFSAQVVSMASKGVTWIHVAEPPVPPKVIRKLTDADHDEIRRLVVVGGMSQSAVARRFEIDPSHVSRLIHGTNRGRSRRSNQGGQ